MSIHLCSFFSCLLKPFDGWTPWWCHFLSCLVVSLSSKLHVTLHWKLLSKHFEWVQAVRLHLNIVFFSINAFRIYASASLAFKASLRFYEYKEQRKEVFYTAPGFGLTKSTLSVGALCRFPYPGYAILYASSLWCSFHFQSGKCLISVWAVLKMI